MEYFAYCCSYGCGSKLNRRGYAGFGPCFHLPGQAILEFLFFEPQPYVCFIQRRPLKKLALKRPQHSPREVTSSWMPNSLCALSFSSSWIPKGPPRIFRCEKWVWVKIEPPQHRRFWSMLQFTNILFWVPIFDPHPNGKQKSKERSASFSLQWEKNRPPKGCSNKGHIN